MGETIYAVFGDPSRAERAAGALLDHGVLPAEISLVISEEYRRRRSMTSMTSGEPGPIPEAPLPPRKSAGYDASAEYAERHGAGFPEYDPGEAANHRASMTTPEDGGAEAAKGRGFGVAVGPLAGLAAITIPGFGLVIGGGPLATAIAGMIPTKGSRAIADDLVELLKDQGMPPHLIPAYQVAHQNGGAILSVHLPTKLPRGAIDMLLMKFGAGSLASYRGYMA